MVRDERWENVYAYVMPLSKAKWGIDESIAPKIEQDTIEFRIELPYGNTLWFTQQRAHRLDLAEAQFNLYTFLLDEMVVMMDEYLDGKRSANG